MYNKMIKIKTTGILKGKRKNKKNSCIFMYFCIICIIYKNIQKLPIFISIFDLLKKLTYTTSYKNINTREMQ